MYILTATYVPYPLLCTDSLDTLTLFLRNSTAYIVVHPIAALSLLRTYALYHGYPKVKAFLWVIYGVSATTQPL